VSIHDGNALVGAYRNDDMGSNSGSAYGFIFNDTTVWLEEKFLATDGLANDYYGISVGITYQYSVIGAYGRDDKGASSGAAYIYCNSCDTMCTPEMTLTPSGTISIPQTSGTDQVSISNTGNCTMSWRCRSSASWLTITGDSTGSGPGTVDVSYSSNPGNARTAELIFTSTDAFNAPESVSFSQEQGADITLESDSINAGEDTCWFATSTVTVPETDGYYLIEDNAEVTIAAGESIRFLPGTKAEAGSYLHAYIGSDPCATGSVIIMPEEENETVISEQEKNIGSAKKSNLTIYPNPADDIVNILLHEDTTGSRIYTELYSIMNKQVSRKI
jgi:archaellum component FlaG (FlaF/FlaG flagellin family)